MKRNTAYSRDAAETLAIDALGWIASTDDLLDAFMGASGVGRDHLRDRLDDPDFLAAILDFLLMNDAWITGFCDARDLPYEAPASARAALPGGAQVHWT
ncbi:DUF3572 domain-containing protein [Maribius pontilimi]|uniref:DUF3572 domain-containing protein n=1 Tax=Palleronia pontilimi TaxID=1964209 RepID=A0A934MD33_9RHOB|nr:DUF3572 domain-containing protein [Palleronia pontilimi]MBJ3763443.1 DUF3572 domain-containing protein [Palleronia pontilimi]